MWNESLRRYTPHEMIGPETEICARFAPRIRVFARRYLRDASATEDFTQEILLTVIQALRAGRIEQPERMGAFVLGVCRMVLRDSRKSTQRREELMGRFGADLVAQTAPAEPELDARRLEQCMAKLGETDRTVLALTFYADRGAPEIAAELGISTGNVRVVRHRALVRLTACVRGESGGGT
jgi:RNA polymerase sigma-70 factor (ECF subfamily)